MRSDIEEILSKKVEEVINSPLSLKLLKIYSALYLGGGQPRWCERSQTNYYHQLAIDGLKKFEDMEKSGCLYKTCEMRADALIYISALAMHVTNSNITDAIAIEGLSKGWFKESVFIKLPESTPIIEKAKPINVNKKK